MTRLDPQGKRALFEAPISASADQLRAGQPRLGRTALFSTGGPEPGTVLLACSSCEARTRLSLADLGVRILAGSLLVPWRQSGWLVRCPSCGRRAWCSVSFRD